MEREQFIVSKCAQQINSCRDQLFDIYTRHGYAEEIETVKALLSKIAQEETIRVVFIGQYTAGKSSIISALTGNTDIKIDSDIATNVVSDYRWSDGAVLTDTPGLYTENPNHDQQTIEMIRQSDLLIYCITSDLFNQYTKTDFEKWAFEKGYSGKMFLVINKMSKESGEYSTLTENYSITLNRSLCPHTISEFPCAFVDARDYRSGLENNDAELIQFSHFEDFIVQLNRFIAQKGQLGKLDTPIKILKDSIDKMVEATADNDQNRAYLSLLSRIEKRVDQRRSQAKADICNCIRRDLRPISDKGYDLSRSVGIDDVDFTENDLNELVRSSCEQLDKDLSSLIEKNMQELNNDISEVMSSDTATFFFNAVGGAVSEKTFLPSKNTKISRAQFESVRNTVSQITGRTVSLATKEGISTTGFFLKTSEVAGSKLHEIVKLVGGMLGHKFKPWEAVKIAKNIGNAAKVAGPVLSVFGLIFDAKETVDEAQQSERIAQEQLKYRQYFIDIANDLEQQYMEHVSGLFVFYKSRLEEIHASRSQIQHMIADRSSMSGELTALKSQLTDIQNEIF